MIEENKKLDFSRFMSLVLADACMRYREAHWREDVEAYKSNVFNLFMEQGNTLDKGFSKRAEKKSESLSEDFKKKQEFINKNLYNTIESVFKGLSKEKQVMFDNYVVGVSMIIEEFVKAKNTTELLTLAKLYNDGMLNGIFEKKEEENNELKSPPCSNHDTETALAVTE